MTDGGRIDIGDWLRGLGLGQYEAAFRENEIDDTVLPTLTAEDRKDLGADIAKPHVSLEAFAGAVAPKPPAAITENVVSIARLEPAKPKWRAHTSPYISKNVQRMIRRIAADLDRKPHDLLLEAVNDVLIKYGKPSIAELDSQ